MNIILPPELQAYVDQQVLAGVYQSPSEVINAGLLLLRDAEELLPTDPADLAEMRRRIREGIEQADRGDFVEFDAQQVSAEARQRKAAKRLE